MVPTSLSIIVIKRFPCAESVSLSLVPETVLSAVMVDFLGIFRKTGITFSIRPVQAHWFMDTTVIVRC